MAYTAADYQALRDDTGRTTDTFDDEAAQAVFDRAATLYVAAGVYAGARVLLLRPDWQQATEQAIQYSQNEESEDLREVAKAKERLLLYWEGRVTADIANDKINNRASAARFGRTSRKPVRVREWPGP